MADQVNPWDVVEDVGEAAAKFGGMIPVIGPIVAAAGNAAGVVADLAQKGAKDKRKAKKGHRKAKAAARKAKGNAHKQGEGMKRRPHKRGKHGRKEVSESPGTEAAPVPSAGPKPALLIGGAAALGLLAVVLGRK